MNKIELEVEEVPMNYEKLCREQIAELSPWHWPKAAVWVALTYAVLAVAQAIRDASKLAK